MPTHRDSAKAAIHGDRMLISKDPSWVEAVQISNTTLISRTAALPPHAETDLRSRDLDFWADDENEKEAMTFHGREDEE